MTSTTSVPATIQLKPSRLAGLLLAAVALAAAVTWAVAVLAIDSSTDNDQGAPSAAVTPQQITAAYPDVFGATGGALAGIGAAGSFIPPQGAPVPTPLPNPAPSGEIDAGAAFIPPQG